MITITDIKNEPTAQRGASALHAAIRACAEALQSHVIGVPLETTHQLERADALLAEAARSAEVWDDAELAAATLRAKGVLAALRVVTR